MKMWMSTLKSCDGRKQGPQMESACHVAAVEETYSHPEALMPLSFPRKASDKYMHTLRYYQPGYSTESQNSRIQSPDNVQYSSTNYMWLLGT